MLGKLDVHIQKDEISPVSITLHKKQLQMDQGPKHETWNIETAGRKPKQWAIRYGCRKRPLQWGSVSPGIKANIWWTRHHRTKKLLHSYRNNQLGEIEIPQNVRESLQAISDKGLISRIFQELRKIIKIQKMTHKHGLWIWIESSQKKIWK